MLVAHSLYDAAVTVDHAERLSAWRGESDLLRWSKAAHLRGIGTLTDAFLPNAMQTVTNDPRFLEEGRAVQ